MRNCWFLLFQCFHWNTLRIFLWVPLPHFILVCLVANNFVFNVLIQLADNTVVYSKGVGNVVFNSVISGRVARPVEFTWVLHIPKLQHNLLAVLYLSWHCGINIHISSTECTMVFSINGEQLFVAQINQDNSAFLTGTMITFTEQAHHLISTLPVDSTRWHCHLGHHGYDVVNKIVHQNLVTGMHINTQTKPDPIREPCLAGKMFEHASFPFFIKPEH